MIRADAVIAALRGQTPPAVVNGADRLPHAMLPRALAAWEAARPQREAAALAATLAAATTPDPDALAAIDRAARLAFDMLPDEDEAPPSDDAAPGPAPVNDPPAKE